MMKLLLLSLFGLVCQISCGQSREMEAKLVTIPEFKPYLRSVRSIEDEDENENEDEFEHNYNGLWGKNEYNQAPKFYLATQSSGRMDIENDSDFISSLTNVSTYYFLIM